MALSEICRRILSRLARTMYVVCADILDILVRASAGGVLGIFVSRWHGWIPRPRFSAISVFIAPVILWLALTRSAVSISMRGHPPVSIVILSPLGIRSTSLPTLSQYEATNARIDQLLESLAQQERAIQLLDLDNVARPDFALYSAGAKVYSPVTSATRRPSTRERRLELWPHGPAMALHHETQAGYCWQFSGQHGRLGIELFQRIHVEEITVEHIAALLSHDRSSAPRHMSLWGLVEGSENVHRAIAWQERGRLLGQRKHFALELDDYPDDVRRLLKTARWAPIADFEYNTNSTSAVQTFAVDEDVRGLDVDFGTVMLLIHDNWGHEDYTCLYRVRVHGRTLKG